MEEWTYQEQYEMEDHHWWFRSRRRVLWALVHRSHLMPSLRILDAGCGTGRNLVEFARLGSAEGVDTSQRAVEFCHRRRLQGVQLAPVEQLPFEDDRFDLLLATDVIEHVADDGLALAELRRVAAPGAHLIITVPAYQWLWSRHDVYLHHYRRYTRRALRERAGAQGWGPVIDTYFYSTMLPPVALVRTAQRFRSEMNDGSDLQVSPRAFDRWLELPVRGEAKLIERGVSMPAGVSLAMVCTVR